MGALASLFNGPATYTPTASNVQGANVINPLSAGNATQALSGSQQALGTQQGLVNSLLSQNGVGNQNSVFNQQQALSNALQSQAMGNGPNPAQAALNQNTGTNVANQAALMAGQRGASANVGELARQAALTGAQTQQGAVGQAATLQAQQQLASEQQLGQQQQNMANLANTQVGNQLTGTQNLTGSNQAQQNSILQGIGSQNTANIANQSDINTVNSANQQNINNVSGGMAQQANQNQAGIFGSLLNAAGSVLSGGLVGGKGKAYGGEIENPKLAAVSEEDRFPDHIQKISTIYHGDSLSNPKYAYGGDVGTQLKAGGKVPGKAKMKGDHPANDTVAAKLSPGEVVIPKSVMESDNPAQGAADFVAALQKKKKDQGVSSNVGDFKEALSRAIAGRKKK